MSMQMEMQTGYLPSDEWVLSVALGMPLEELQSRAAGTGGSAAADADSLR